MGGNLLTIGLTGPTGAGKSSLLPLLRLYGCAVIDCDEVSREVVQPGSPALAELSRAFGRDILLPDGSLDRAKLAGRAFSSPEGCELLSAITHPYIRQRCELYISRAHECGMHAVVDAPVLFESGFDELCDTTVAVIADRDIRLSRIMARDGIDEEAARRRMSVQHEDSYYTDRAEHTIYNNGTLSELFEIARPTLEFIFSEPDDEVTDR